MCEGDSMYTCSRPEPRKPAELYVIARRTGEGTVPDVIGLSPWVKKKESQITPTPNEMGLSTPRSGGGGAAQGHPNQSSGARSTTMKVGTANAAGQAGEGALGSTRQVSKGCALQLCLVAHSSAHTKLDPYNCHTHLP